MITLPRSFFNMFVNAQRLYTCNLNTLCAWLRHSPRALFIKLMKIWWPERTVRVQVSVELHLSTGPSNNRQWDIADVTPPLISARNLVVCVLSQPILRYKLLETMGDYQERLVKSGLLYNGSTQDFGSYSLGSNPGGPTREYG